jgi:Major Facilitator Superfamily
MAVNDPQPGSSSPDGAATAVAAGPPQPSRAGGMLSPLRRRNFSLLFSGQLISVVGDQVYGLALPWTVLAVTGDPRQMAFVLTAATIPRVLLLLVGGALADRLNPRVVMLAADAGRALVVGALGVTLFAGLPPLWVVAALAALEGAGSGLFGPGVQALIPRILPDGELPAGNGLMMIVQYSTLAVGPLLGGVATAAQATFAFLADAGSFVISTLTLLGIRLPARSPSRDPSPGGSDVRERKGLLGEIGAGIGYAFGQPLIRSTMLVTIFANFGIAGTLGVALIVLSRNLSRSPVTLGVLLAAIGVGGIIGGLSSGLVARLRHRGIVALVLFGFGALFLGLTPVAAGPAAQLPVALGLDLDPTTRIAIVSGLLGFLGLIAALGDTMFLTIMQQRIAPEYLARVFSVQFVAGGVMQPASLVAAGYFAAVFGPGMVFLGGGALLLLAVLLGLSSRALRRI